MDPLRGLGPRREGSGLAGVGELCSRGLLSEEALPDSESEQRAGELGQREARHVPWRMPANL
jgi:hypothetical protein